MASWKYTKTGVYRSLLESRFADFLNQHNIKFGYETEKVELLPKSKGLKTFESGKWTNSIRAITYTPDFIGPDWVVEIKGRMTPDFSIKWKIFKTNHAKNRTLFLLRNQKQFTEFYEWIKESSGRPDHPNHQTTGSKHTLESNLQRVTRNTGSTSSISKSTDTRRKSKPSKRSA